MNDTRTNRSAYSLLATIRQRVVFNPSTGGDGTAVEDASHAISTHRMVPGRGID